MHMSSCDTLFFYIFILKKTWIVLHMYHFDPYLYHPLSILQRRGEFHFIFIISTFLPPSLFQFHVNYEEVKWV